MATDFPTPEAEIADLGRTLAKAVTAQWAKMTKKERGIVNRAVELEYLEMKRVEGSWAETATMLRQRNEQLESWIAALIVHSWSIQVRSSRGRGRQPVTYEVLETPDLRKAKRIATADDPYVALDAAIQQAKAAPKAKREGRKG